MHSLMLTGESAKLQLDIFGWENISADNISDASWLCGEVRLDVLEFKATYSANFTIQNFENLHESTDKCIKNLKDGLVINFNTEEEQLEFSIKFNALGNAVVQGAASSGTCEPAAMFNFLFNTDFISVKKLASQVSIMIVELKSQNKYFNN